MLQDKHKLSRLIKSISKGDQIAYSEFVELMMPKIKAITFSITGNSEDMKDAVQDTFVAIVQKSDTYQKQTNPQGWVYEITRNKSYDILRKKQKTVPLYENLNESDQSWENSENRIFLIQISEKLNEEEKTLLALRYWCDMTYKEMSRYMHQPISSIQSKLNRIYEKLKYFEKNS